MKVKRSRRVVWKCTAGILTLALLTWGLVPGTLTPKAFADSTSTSSTQAGQMSTQASSSSSSQELSSELSPLAGDGAGNSHDEATSGSNAQNQGDNQGNGNQKFDLLDPVTSGAQESNQQDYYGGEQGDHQNSQQSDQSNISLLNGGQSALGNEISPLGEGQVQPRATATQGMDFAKESSEGHWNANAILETDGYTWDENTRTLTLDGFSLQITQAENLIPFNNGAAKVALNLPVDSTIKLVGEPSSILIDVDSSGTYGACAGIAVAGSTSTTYSFLNIVSEEETPLTVQCDVGGAGLTTGVYSPYFGEFNLDGVLTVQVSSTSAEMQLCGIVGDRVSVSANSSLVINTFDRSEEGTNDATYGLQARSLSVSGDENYASPNTRVSINVESLSENRTTALVLYADDPTATGSRFSVENAARIELASSGPVVGFIISGNDQAEEQLKTWARFGSSYVMFGNSDSVSPTDTIVNLCGIPLTSGEKKDRIPYRYLCMVPVSLKSVSVVPDKTTLAPGQSRSFEVHGQANYPSNFPTDQDIASLVGVSWSVGDNESTETTMDGSTLKVGSNETASLVHVFAKPSAQFNEEFPKTPWMPATAEVTITHESASGDQASANDTSKDDLQSGHLAKTADDAPSFALTAGFMALAALAARAALYALSGRKAFARSFERSSANLDTHQREGRK